MNLEHFVLGETNQSQKDKRCVIPLTGPSSRRMVAGMRGVAGERELVFNGHRVSVWNDEVVQDMDNVDGCTRNGASPAFDLH